MKTYLPGGRRPPTPRFVCFFCEKVIAHSLSHFVEYGRVLCSRRCVCLYHNKLIEEGKSLMKPYTDEEIEAAAPPIRAGAETTDEAARIHELLKHGHKN